MPIKELRLQLVLKFLKDNGYTQSFLNLEIQSKINLREYPKEIEFFKKILLKGDFNEAVQFIWTFEQKIQNATLKKLTLQIYKQKLYELLENPNEMQLRNLFQKQIINVSSEEEYQHLFTLLTCRSVKQIPGMDNWSPMKGRYSCFEQIQPYLEGFFSMLHFQKANNKIPTFSLEEAIQSYLSGQQRMEKSQRPIQQSKHFATDKQSKESIESKPSNQSKSYKFDSKGSDQKNQKVPQSLQFKKSQTNLNANPSISRNGSNINKIPVVYEQQRKSQVQQLEMSESRMQKSQYSQKYERSNTEVEQEQNIIQGSTFGKKYNPYIANSNASSNLYTKSKITPNYSAFPVKIENLEEEQKVNPSSYKEIRQKEFDRNKQKKSALLTPSYLKQFSGSDSQAFQEEVRKNIAYLDQNNSSVVYKDDQNENFTFSNGAEESGIHDKNRRILKLTSFNDPKAIRTCQFSPSGSLFALGTNSSYLKIYDIEQLIQTNQSREILPICQIPQLHTKSIFCLDWSKNQKSIVTCSNDLTIKITQFVQGFNYSNYKTNVIGRHESCIRMVKFNSLQNRIVSCGDDSLLKIWDIGKIKKCTNLKGHTQSISAFRFAHNEQDNIIYSVSKDCTIRKWDLRVGQCVTVSDVQESQLTFIANHIDRIVVSHKSGYVSFFNQSLQMEHAVQIHEQEIRSIDGTTYDDLLLTASFDGHISIFTQKTSQSPNYHQHNENQDDKVVYATFLNHPDHHGFASTSTLGICNIYSYE